MGEPEKIGDILARLEDKWKRQVAEHGDPRLTGKPSDEWVAVNCPYCEDEGIVYIVRERGRVRTFEALRCCCHAEGMAERSTAKHGKAHVERFSVPDWKQNGLRADEIMSARVTGFYDLRENRLMLPEGEPRVVDYRRRERPCATGTPGENRLPPA